MPITRVVSFSEIDCFRQCPFKHELAYKQRWSKTPSPGTPLSRGTLFHAVMENHYGYLKARRQKDLAELERCSRNITSLLEGPGDADEQELVAWMYVGYVERFGDDDNWEIIAVEYANEFWLPTERGGRSNFKMKVKIDLIVRDRRTGSLWIVDHKSCKNLPTDRMLELDDQFGLYTWGVQQLGMKVMGAIHNACRTQRNKGPMEMSERFLRTMLYRTDEELQTIAVEAYRTARRAYAIKPGEAERAPNSDSCRWKCDFTESCLGARKDRDPQGYLQHSLTLGGFSINKERH